ncbi:MAG: esterase-like activity of phytase family protein [Ferruginibacter sp.]
MRSISRLLLFSFIVCHSLSCSTSKKSTNAITASNISSLKFLGEYDLPHNLPFNNTTVGGLSSIDYDIKNDCYYMICDDRSAINPARFYTAKIFFTAHSIDSVRFIDVKSLLQPNGNVYPNNKQDKMHVPDPEAMRYNPSSGNLVWSSEGERIIKSKDTVLEDPEINIISKDGKYQGNFPLPSNLKMQLTEKGPRQNGVLEGMSFADHYRTLYVNVEEPLYEDGPRADVTDNNTFIRLLKFDVASKQNTKQFAYKLEPVAHPAKPENEFKINGVPDILWLGNNKLMVTERSFSTGRMACTIRVFIADLSNATDIKEISSLKANKDFKPVQKKLLLNMDDLGIYIDNIEGATFGPVLPNGHKTLLFVADNNFAVAEKTQFLLFEVME